uniref:Uncharacterized protein n=1 Tax=Amorphochlora amoebiformis TaxID=1561963 RepID=A0A7S0DRW2_9EUKA|mmetsp:Transcript_766/g.1086  ORF Transcript_766/g.1086 Transcript_766/m.1086 type:complete len:116 (+) Transcript_766:88-435(+)
MVMTKRESGELLCFKRGRHAADDIEQVLGRERACEREGNMKQIEIIGVEGSVRQFERRRSITSATEKGIQVPRNLQSGPMLGYREAARTGRRRRQARGGRRENPLLRRAPDDREI